MVTQKLDDVWHKTALQCMHRESVGDNAQSSSFLLVQQVPCFMTVLYLCMLQ
jgi:hypothetical protein